jgi:predicted nucleic acid-binding protein
MKGERCFLDTNVLIYAFAKSDPRAEIAERLLSGGGVIGVQCLNEFVAVATRKLGMPWSEVLSALRAIRALCPPPVPLTVRIHEAGLRIATKYGYRIYDSLVVAAALESRCSTLYSEDLADGQSIETLTVRNPFRRT